MLEAVARLAGKWTGTNRLWLTPQEAARESATTMAVAPAAQGRFLTFTYTWADEGKPQDGVLLLGHEDDEVTGAWIDSWHMGNKVMVSRGAANAAGGVSIAGTYAAPPGPDWGWHTVVEPRGADTFRFAMYNITPDGEESLAVEVIYTRAR
ncbi:MAG: DUF1579 domain-containing protein [Gemmatimonadota bacterium]|nr:DUF1579 domain-containing protein [Gemmatimonadota bacterium]